MPEHSRYIRGMRSWVGLRQTGFEYERQIREAGDSKYSLRQLLKLAGNGIYNFSELPIKIITWLGVGAISIGLAYLLIVLIDKIFYHNVPQGFTGLLMAIILFSGVQLISLGILGEYIIRIFFEVKNRPIFLVDKRIENGEEKQ